MCDWQRDVLLTRRGLITLSAGLLVANSGLASRLLTPPQTAGPFYPRVKPSDSDADLTRIDGRGAGASGQVITVSGKVFSFKGPPLADAIVEIWQADANGRYHHPFDTKGQDRDQNFQGFGAVRTAADGSFRFKTIKPRYYRAGSIWRTPHIHFRVLAAAGRELVTQMYFPGEAMNANDVLFLDLASEAARDAATAVKLPGDEFAYRYDIVLA